MEKKYYDLIVKLVKEHKKYPLYEAILEDIVNDVYEHSKVVLGSVTNEDIIIAYINKVVSTSIITVPKKMNFNTRVSHRVITTGNAVNLSVGQTAEKELARITVKTIEPDIEDKAPVESVIEEQVDSLNITEDNFEEEKDETNLLNEVENEVLNEDLESLFNDTDSIESLSESLDDNIVTTFEQKSDINDDFEENLAEINEYNSSTVELKIESVDKALVDMMINGVSSDSLDVEEETAELEVEEVNEIETFEESSDEIVGLEEETAELEVEEVNEIEIFEESSDEIVGLEEETAELEVEEVNEIETFEESSDEIEGLEEETAELEVEEVNEIETLEESSDDIVGLEEETVELEVEEVNEIETLEESSDDIVGLEEETAELEVEELNEIETFEESSDDIVGLEEETAELEVEEVDEIEALEESSDDIFELVEDSEVCLLEQEENVTDEEVVVANNDYSIFKCFSFEPSNIEYDSEEIYNDLKNVSDKYPNKRLFEIYDLKYNKNLSISEICVKLDIIEDDVIDVLNEIVDLVKD